jgi:hypothetical protein
LSVLRAELDADHAHHGLQRKSFAAGAQSFEADIQETVCNGVASLDRSKSSWMRQY